MNDFTKEELKMLLGGISLWMEEIAFMESKGDPYDCLYMKIKSMIDNYCDHKRGFRLVYDNETELHICRDCGDKQ